MSGYEIEEVCFIDRLYDGNGFFLDIGANIGLVSIPFTIMQNNRHPSSNIVTYCFEAISSNHQTLVKNIEENVLHDNIRSFCIGLGDSEKEVDIQVEGNLRNNEGTGTANIIAEKSTYKCERIKLQISTIDNMVSKKIISGNDCSLIKIDTDGYDFFILMGMEGLIKDSRPIIFGEFMAHCLNWHDQSIADVINFMEKYNYQSFGRIKGSFMFSDHIDVETYVSDLLLIPLERVSEFKWCIYQ